MPVDRLSVIERWTVCRRTDWPEREGNPWIVPPGVGAPYPDSELEVFDVVPASALEGAVERAEQAERERDEWRQTAQDLARQIEGRGDSLMRGGRMADQTASGRAMDRDPCDGCDGTCGDVCPVWEAKRLNSRAAEQTSTGRAMCTEETNRIAQLEADRDRLARAVKDWQAHATTAQEEADRLRLIIADLIEGESADEGTPKWYALRNARSALAADEEGHSDG